MNLRTDSIMASADAVTARKAVLAAAASKADRLASALRRAGVATLDTALPDLLSDVEDLGNTLAALLPPPVEEERAAVEDVVALVASPPVEEPVVAITFDKPVTLPVTIESAPVEAPTPVPVAPKGPRQRKP